MILKKAAYEKFIQLYKNRYGVTLTFDQAVKQGDKLLRYTAKIHKIKTKEYNQHHDNDHHSKDRFLLP